MTGRWHVLLNVNGMAPLKRCYNDMEYAKRQWLDSKPDIDLVFLNDTDAPESLLPTKANFDRHLNRIVTEAAENDLVVVMISTHGVAHAAKSFICPLDTLSTEFSSETSDKSAVLEEGENNGLISITGLLETLRSSKAAASLLVLDACRIDAIYENGDFLQEFQETLRRGNEGSLAVMTSCGLHQRAYETTAIDSDGNEITCGVFMRNLIDGLSGKADFGGSLDG